MTRTAPSPEWHRSVLLGEYMAYMRDANYARAHTVYTPPDPADGAATTEERCLRRAQACLDRAREWAALCTDGAQRFTAQE